MKQYTPKKRKNQTTPTNPLVSHPFRSAASVGIPTTSHPRDVAGMISPARTLGDKNASTLPVTQKSILALPQGGPSPEASAIPEAIRHAVIHQSCREEKERNNMNPLFEPSSNGFRPCPALPDHTIHCNLPHRSLSLPRVRLVHGRDFSCNGRPFEFSAYGLAALDALELFPLQEFVPVYD